MDAKADDKGKGAAEDPPAKDEPAKDEPAKDEPAESDPPKDEPAKDEPAKDEPAEDEPAEDEPAEDEPAEDEPPKKTERAKSEAPKKAEPAKAVEAVKRVFPLSPLKALGLMLLSGLFYWLAFPTMDLWPFALITWVPYFIAVRKQPPRRALWLGLVAGLIMTCAGFYWLLDMLKTFSGFPAPICAIFVLIVNLYQGGRFAFQSWIGARAEARGWPSAPVYVVAFVASELVFPLLFPWYFAACVHTFPTLMQTADLGGPIFTGVLLVLFNLALAEVALARMEKRPLDRRVVYAGAGALGFALVYGIARTAMVESMMRASEEIKVGYVQGNMGLFQKREDPGEGLRRHKRLTAELKEEGVDLAVWSESSVTFAVAEDMYKGFMKDRVSRSLGVPSIFGAVVYRVPEGARDFKVPRSKRDRERWFNTALASNAAGDITGRYDKQFLLAFGEYLPFGDTFPQLYEWSPNSGRFSKGTSNDSIAVEIKGKERKVSVMICYEDILPGFVNGLVRAGDPELLVNITNDAWFGDTGEPWEHLALAKFRAVEHRRYLVRSTNTGVSAIVDPIGRAVVKSSTFKAEKGSASARLIRTTTLYEIVGDVPWWIVSAAGVLAAFVRRRKPEAT